MDMIRGGQSYVDMPAFRTLLVVNVMTGRQVVVLAKPTKPHVPVPQSPT